MAGDYGVGSGRGRGPSLSSDRIRSRRHCGQCGARRSADPQIILAARVPKTAGGVTQGAGSSRRVPGGRKRGRRYGRAAPARRSRVWCVGRRWSQLPLGGPLPTGSRGHQSPSRIGGSNRRSLGAGRHLRHGRLGELPSRPVSGRLFQRRHRICQDLRSHPQGGLALSQLEGRLQVPARRLGRRARRPGPG